MLPPAGRQAALQRDLPVKWICRAAGFIRALLSFPASGTFLFCIAVTQRVRAGSGVAREVKNIQERGVVGTGNDNPRYRYWAGDVRMELSPDKKVLGLLVDGSRT